MGHTWLAARLKSERMKRGLSVRKVSGETGVARNTIADIENGRRIPTADTVRTLAGHYSIDADQLLEEAYGDPLVTSPTATPEASSSEKVEVGEDEDTEEVVDALYRAAFGIYKTRRQQILDFEDLSPTERKDTFEDVWHAVKYLRHPRVLEAGDRATTLLHEALTQAALRMVAVYDLLDLKEGQAEGGEVLDLEAARRALRQREAS